MKPCPDVQWGVQGDRWFDTYHVHGSTHTKLSFSHACVLLSWSRQTLKRHVHLIRKVQVTVIWWFSSSQCKRKMLRYWTDSEGGCPDCIACASEFWYSSNLETCSQNELCSWLTWVPIHAYKINTPRQCLRISMSTGWFFVIQNRLSTL